ncbi:hypothetical protein EJ110_NYTH02553 [Nymphaea thermarum]|nr:hypothetical protein EJ110_NYTH02553 [Nymphaea thermarum]
MMNQEDWHHQANTCWESDVSQLDSAGDGEKQRSLVQTFNFSIWKAGLMILLLFAHSSPFKPGRPVPSPRTFNKPCTSGIGKLPDLLERTSFTISGSTRISCGVFPDQATEISGKINESLGTGHTILVNSLFKEGKDSRSDVMREGHGLSQCLLLHSSCILRVARQELVRVAMDSLPLECLCKLPGLPPY